VIERLVGTCAHKTPHGIILDVQGVGYGVEMTELAQAKVQVGQPLTVWVYTHVREEALRLFGFLSYDERQLFALLLTVSGVGPKLGIGILSHVDSATLLDAVERDDAEILENVPGIGARQSKKIILELKPKVPKLSGIALTAPSAPQTLFGATKAGGISPEVLKDLRSALDNFGYKDKEYAPVLKKLEKEAKDLDLAALIRTALAELTGAAAARNQETLF
jgi:Holliday junction DNA helicase RuvA